MLADIYTLSIISTEKETGHGEVFHIDMYDELHDRNDMTTQRLASRLAHLKIPKLSSIIVYIIPLNWGEICISIYIHNTHIFSATFPFRVWLICK